MVESGDEHVLKLHLPLSEAPLFVSQAVEWEHLHGVGEHVFERRSGAHIAVFLEVFNVPSDMLRDLPDQLTFRHRT